MKKSKVEKLYKSILAIIKKDAFLLNQKIWTEHEAARIFNVSRITVRQAYARLIEEGYITSRPRIGAILISKNPRTKGYEIISDTGFKLEKLEFKKPGDDIKNILQIENDKKIIHLVRKNKPNNSISETWLNIAISNVEIEDFKKGLGKFVENQGISITKIYESMKSQGSQIIRKRVTIDKNMNVIEYSITKYEKNTFDILIEYER